MISSNANSSRVDRSAYWGYFAAAFILPILFVVGGISSLSAGSYSLGILAILAVIPINIYFRVIMMRRCRDIGWPAWLPWITYTAVFLTSYSVIMDVMRGNMNAVAGFGLFNLLSLLDFGLMITIGCFQSQPWTQPEYSPDDYRPSPRPIATKRASHGGFESQRPALNEKSISGQFSALHDAYPTPAGQDAFSDDSQHDKAIAQALAEYRARQAGETTALEAQRQEQPEPIPPQAHSPAPPRAIGFGRKQV